MPQPRPPLPRGGRPWPFRHQYLRYRRQFPVNPIIVVVVIIIIIIDRAGRTVREGGPRQLIRTNGRTDGRRRSPSAVEQNLERKAKISKEALVRLPNFSN